MKKKLIITTIAMAAALTIGGCSSVKEDSVVLSVGDTNVTAGVAGFYARFNQAQYETYYGAYLGENMWTQEAEEGKTYEDTVKESVIDTLERAVLEEQHMEEYGVEISEADQKKIDETAEKFDKANDSGSKKKILAGTESVKRALTLMMVDQKMTEAIGEKADIKVTDKDAAQKKMDYVYFTYINSDSDDDTTMTDDEKAEIKKNAEAFLKEAKNDPEKFEKLAEDHGSAMESATFDSESATPDEALVAAADKLKEGELTDVIETENGCYVAKLVSTFDKDATETKKASMIQEKKSEYCDEVIDGWKEEAKINVDKKVWEKIDFKTLQVTIKQEEETEE